MLTTLSLLSKKRGMRNGVCGASLLQPHRHRQHQHHRHRLLLNHQHQHSHQHQHQHSRPLRPVAQSYLLPTSTKVRSLWTFATTLGQTSAWMGGCWSQKKGLNPALWEGLWGRGKLYGFGLCRKTAETAASIAVLALISGTTASLTQPPFMMHRAT